MNLSPRSARPSDRRSLRARATAVLAATGLLVASVVSFSGTGAATAGGVVHLPTPGAPITIIIHTPHPECWVCVD